MQTEGQTIQKENSDPNKKKVTFISSKHTKPNSENLALEQMTGLEEVFRKNVNI